MKMGGPVSSWSKIRGDMVRPIAITAAALAALLILAAERPHSAQALQQPPRDTSASRANPTPPSAKIAGTVVTADTGKPVKRARVLATAVELAGGRAALTDERGSYELTDLPPGRYSIAGAKCSFITHADR